MEALIAAGADVHATDGSGATPLHYAARNRVGSEYDSSVQLGHDVDVITALIRVGLEVQAPDKRGGTPPHYAAAKAGDVRVLDTLIRAGADPSAIDTHGNTAYGTPPSAVISRRSPPLSI